MLCAPKLSAPCLAGWRPNPPHRPRRPSTGDRSRAEESQETRRSAGRTSTDKLRSRIRSPAGGCPLRSQGENNPCACHITYKIWSQHSHDPLPHAYMHAHAEEALSKSSAHHAPLEQGLQAPEGDLRGARVARSSRVEMQCLVIHDVHHEQAPVIGRLCHIIACMRGSHDLNSHILSLLP